MKRVLTVISMICVVFIGEKALAVDSVGKSTMTKRQVIVQTVSCMRKRMSADKIISYNGAAKACKDQITKQTDHPAFGTLVASDIPAKQ
jgi:hypothetical protein